MRIRCHHHHLQVKMSHTIDDSMDMAHWTFFHKKPQPVHNKKTQSLNNRISELKMIGYDETDEIELGEAKSIWRAINQETGRRGDEGRGAPLQVDVEIIYQGR